MSYTTLEISVPTDELARTKAEVKRLLLAGAFSDSPLFKEAAFSLYGALAREMVKIEEKS